MNNYWVALLVLIGFAIGLYLGGKSTDSSLQDRYNKQLLIQQILEDEIKSRPTLDEHEKAVLKTYGLMREHGKGCIIFINDGYYPGTKSTAFFRSEVKLNEQPLDVVFMYTVNYDFVSITTMEMAEKTYWLPR